MYIENFANCKLSKLRKAWRGGRRSGAYLLFGSTGCGKTTFLNSIFDENIKIDRYLGCDISEMIVESIRSGRGVDSPICNVVFIENIDYVLSTDATKKEFFRLVKKWADDEAERLIICTAESNAYAEGYKWLIQIEMKPIKIRRTVICAAAIDRQLTLSHKQIRDLKKCVSMTELNEKLNRIRLFSSIESKSEDKE